MLKPFYNKKKNIDDRLVPAVSSADAGKVLGVTEEGKIAAVEGGGEDYDLIITSSLSFDFTSANNITLTKGDFNSVLAKLLSTKQVKIKIISVSGTETNPIYEEGLFSYISGNSYGININFSFIGQSRFNFYNGFIGIQPNGTLSYAMYQAIGS